MNKFKKKTFIRNCKENFSNLTEILNCPNGIQIKHINVKSGNENEMNKTNNDKKTVIKKKNNDMMYKENIPGV